MYPFHSSIPLHFRENPEPLRRMKCLPKDNKQECSFCLARTLLTLSEITNFSHFVCAVFFIYFCCFLFLFFFQNTNSVGLFIYISYNIAAFAQLFVYCVGGTFVSDSVSICNYLLMFVINWKTQGYFTNEKKEQLYVRNGRHFEGLHCLKRKAI